MNERFLPAREYAALKSAFAQLMRVLGGQSACAQLTRVGQQTLSTYAGLGDGTAELFPPVDVVADLEAEAVSRGSRPFVTECLAALSGFDLERREAGDGHLLRQFTAITTASTEAIARMAEDLADGRVTPEEATETRGSLIRLIDALQRYDAALAGIAGPVSIVGE